MIDTQLILRILLHLLPVLYGFAFFDYVLAFVSEDKTAARLARPLLLCAVAVNFVYFFSYTIFFEHVPMVNVFQVMGAIGFAVAMTYLWVEVKSGTIYTGPFILFFVLTCHIVSSVFPRMEAEVPEILRNRLFGYHVTAAVLGYSAFVVAAVYGFLFLVLYRNIRNKRFGLFFERLPSLDVLDKMNFVAVAFGFAFLTIAIGLGDILSRQHFGSLTGDPKVYAAVITWLVYGAALVARQYKSWRGPRMAYSSLFGFLVVLLSAFAVRLFFNTFHSFSG